LKNSWYKSNREKISSTGRLEKLLVFLLVFFARLFKKSFRITFFMENINYDIGEEAIYKLKELNRMLERILKIIDNEKKSQTPCVS
jgi:hypothetical protein